MIKLAGKVELEPIRQVDLSVLSKSARICDCRCKLGMGLLGVNVRVGAKGVAWAIEHSPEDSCASQLCVEKPLLECEVAITAGNNHFAVLYRTGSPIVHVNIGYFLSIFISFDSIFNDRYDFPVQHISASGVADLLDIR